MVTIENVSCGKRETRDEVREKGRNRKEKKGRRDGAKERGVKEEKTEGKKGGKGGWMRKE